MRPRTGAGGAAVLFAALFPAACLQTWVLPPPGQKGGAGGGGGLSAVDAGGLGGVLDGGDAGGSLTCPNGPGSVLRLSHAAPTVMFAVDHSSSMMTSRLPAPSNGTRLGVVQGVIKDLLGRYANRTNAGYVVNFGYLEFPQLNRGGTCPPNGCCVSNVYLNGQNSIQMAMDRCSSSGAGCLPQDEATSTTTVDALDTASRTFQGLASTDPQKITVLLTDHEPADCSSSGRPCDDAATQIARLENSLNVATYVVAVGDTPSGPSDMGANACLNQMAFASKKGQRGGSTAYYLANTEDRVKQFMTNPVQGSLCYAQVEDSSFDPSRMLVDIDGQVIPRDPTKTNGWIVDDLGNGHQGIMFFGAACENAFLSNQFQKVHATVCPR